VQTAGRLQGMVSIITGGGSGFGESIAHTFAREGSAVVVADLHEPNGRRVAAEITQAGGQALFVRTDVSRPADIKPPAEAALPRSGRIAATANNAGLGHVNHPMPETEREFFDRLFAVNVKSLYHAAQCCVPVFRRQGGGAMINIGSTAAVRPRPGLCWYNGTKAAVTMLTKSMAVELAPDRIRVNAINPALAETPLLPTFMGGTDTPEVRAKFLASIPLGRLCRPSDVANAALFLADPAAEFVTGVCLEVDGGRYI